MTTQDERTAALLKLGAAIFGRNNLIGSDFDHIHLEETEADYEQDRAGVLIQFSISWHALGKIATEQTCEAITVLLPDH